MENIKWTENKAHSNRYFWIKDRLGSEKVMVQYCSTERVLTDFLTIPLQGDLFRKFRSIVLGYKHMSSLIVDEEKLSSQECVGNDVLWKNMTRPDDSTPVINRKKKNNIWADVVKSE